MSFVNGASSMKKVFCFLFAAFAFAPASMIGLDALGEEQSAGGMTSTAGRGFAGGAKTGDAEGVSVVNPARDAFDTKVVFNINFLMEFMAADRHGDTFGTRNITIPSFNLSFPMATYGTIGVSLWQKYSSIMREEVSDSSSSVNAKFEYQSSVFEIVPSYAVRLPFLRNVSIGASAHIVMGSSIRSLTLGPDNSKVSAEDAWATNQTDITDYVDGTWEVKNHPAYYTMAIQYRGRQSSYFFSLTTPHTLLNELEYNFRFSEIDTLEPNRVDREIKIPMKLATGFNFRFMKRNNIMGDLQWSAFDEDVKNIAGSYGMKRMTETQNDILASVGFQRDGSPLFYDPYWDRISYRVGAWYKAWYVKGVDEFGGSVGAGFPLGRKGTTIDVAIQGGKRFTDDVRKWEETFVGIRLGLMGIGSWGKTSR